MYDLHYFVARYLWDLWGFYRIDIGQGNNLGNIKTRSCLHWLEPAVKTDLVHHESSEVNISSAAVTSVGVLVSILFISTVPIRQEVVSPLRFLSIYIVFRFY